VFSLCAASLVVISIRGSVVYVTLSLDHKSLPCRDWRQCTLLCTGLFFATWFVAPSILDVGSAHWRLQVMQGLSSCVLLYIGCGVELRIHCSLVSYT
jgi:hypothetical protein